MIALRRLVPTIILLGTVTAIAQPADAPATPAAPTKPAVQLSVVELKSQSEALQTGIQEDYKYVLGLRERVRKKKDVIKLDCVNERLVQLKAQMNIADTANDSLHGALERDLSEANASFVQLDATAAAIRELREQANQCIGEPELYKQEAGLDVDRPDLVDDPGTIDPYVPEGAEVEPPGYASAFM